MSDGVGAWVPGGRFIVEGRAGGPLAGLRFAAKDVFDVAGHGTSAGNPTWLATHPVPAQHAVVVQQLLDAGATLVGKTITDELAFSLHGDNPHHGAPRNPRAPGRITGGSSSGSAAAVAAGEVAFALGTDTGGSTRVPASYCGLWGLRTTHDLLGRDGLVPLHPSFDTVTWFADDAAVFERVGNVLLPAHDFVPRRVLLPREAWALADEAFDAPRQASIERLGLPVEAIDIAAGESLEHWRQHYATLGAFEAWQLHGDWIRTHRPVFGAAVAARFEAASRVDADQARAARDGLARVRQRVRARVGDDAVLLLPSAATVAPRRDAGAAEIDAIRQRTMQITCIAGLAGLPQVSLPLALGGSGEGPVGVSLAGPARSDLALIRRARAVCP